MQKSKLFILVLFSYSFSLLAQEDRLSESIKSIVEELADNESDPEAGAAFTERLYELSEKPVNLNSADESDLSRLFFLTDFQVKAIADYIHSSGKIISVYEIMNIPGFSRELAEQLIPFITLANVKIIVRDTIKTRSTLLSNISFKSGQTGSVFSGSPLSMLLRYKLAAGRISAGLTAEKDSGEKLLSGKPPLPDFLSMNMAWSGTGILRKIIAGDFSVRFGLGTNINSGLSTGLSLTSSGYLSGGDEIRAYSSTDENNFFRGVAASFKFNRYSISTFISANRIDATIDTTSFPEGNAIKTFYRSGLHNSNSTLSLKNSVTEYSCGISSTYDFKNFRTGIILTGYKFSLPVRKNAGDPERLFDFEGDRNFVMSAFYKAVSGRFIFFGEVSADAALKLAVVQGLSVRPADRLNMNLIYRSYSPGYSSFHGKGPFAASSGDNVRGIFGNFTWEAAKFLFLDFGCDLRWYPWLRYRCSSPSTAKSSDIKLRYQPSAPYNAEFSYGFRLAVYDDPEATGIKKQHELVSRSAKFTFKYSLNDNVNFTTRLDFRMAGPPASKGVLLLQDMSFRFRRIPLKVWLRHCIFRTDDWNSRIYAYENDLPGTFSVPALSGKGSRSYIMLGWKPAEFADLRIKYAFCETGNGADKGISSGEIRIQIKLWF
jgi:hypothetical protein